MRFAFVVFCVVAVTVVTIGLRDANNRLFYEVRSRQSEQERLRQQLWQRELRVEGLIHPDALQRRLEQGTRPSP